MKRCASCGHPEVDHEGLSCRSPEGGYGSWSCGCAGFEDPDQPEDGFRSVYDFPFDTIPEKTLQLFA